MLVQEAGRVDTGVGHRVELLELERELRSKNHAVAASRLHQPASASLPHTILLDATVNAWHCGIYNSACDWKTSTKLLGNNPPNAWNITNRAELEAHGISASIEISKEPKATLTMKSRSLG